MISILALNMMTPIVELIPAVRTNPQAESQISIDLVAVHSIIKTVNQYQNQDENILRLVDTLLNQPDTGKKRNPFQKPIVSAPTPKVSKKNPVKEAPQPQDARPVVNLEGIVWDPQAPVAILNGSIYIVGDRIGGYTIKSIADTMVTLSKGNDIFSVKISKEPK